MNIRGASKCELRFFWNMYGGDIGIFAVHVNTQNPEKIGSRGKWLDSGGSERTVKMVHAVVQYSACHWQGTH